LKTKLELLYENKDINHIYKKCKWTPTLEHWKKIKEESLEKYWQNTIIFYQVGTFYECYFHDAYLTSELVWQTLTSKSKKNPYAAPMSWSPKSAWYERAKKMVKFWYNVIIVDEIWIAWSKDFKREIVQILTPWTNLDIVWNTENNYLYSFYSEYNHISISILDLSSNEFYNTSYIVEDVDSLERYIKKLFSIYPPKESISNKLFLHNYWESLERYFTWSVIKRELISDYKNILKKHFEDIVLFLEKKWEKITLCSLWLILDYVQEIHNTDLLYLNEVSFIRPTDYFFLDEMTISNLEIFKTTDNTKENSLFNTINYTATSFWTRELKKSIIRPLIKKTLIDERLDSVTEIIKRDELFELTEILLQFNDLERIASKLSSKQCTPNDVILLSNSLKLLLPLKKLLVNYKSTYIQKVNSKILTFSEVINLINAKLKEEGGVTSKEWNIINLWVSDELDELLNLTIDKDVFYSQYEERLKKETKISYLKISQNNLGAYIEVKKGTVSISKDWKRIKMLKDYDRYETPELIQFFRKTLDLINKRNIIEYKLFTELRIELSRYISQIQKVTKEVAKIDILFSHSILAKENKYVRPYLQENKNIDIKKWRHPIIEKLTNFTPNDILLKEDSSLHIITGPNMWWKSTYIRQFAIIMLLAQIWSYVPAESAILWITDWIFTRVWASDNLSQWESTFFVEMKETSNILRNITDKSLIILDEIWRGTSTSDGYALSQSICEYLLWKWTRTIFATHYHELNNLEQIYSWVEVYHVSAKIDKLNTLIFEYKLKKWGTDKSYWIEIWKLAWLPEEIVKRATQLKKIKK